MASCAAYPIGVAGQAWGATERAQWLASRTIERLYREEVLLKLEGLKERYVVQQYGELSLDPQRYPLYAVRTKNWAADKPSVLITGGVHGVCAASMCAAMHLAAARSLDGLT